jgi:hypothetical protein
MKKALILFGLSLFMFSANALTGGNGGKKGKATTKVENPKRKTCEELCEEMSTKLTQIKESKEQAKEKGIAPRDKAKLQKQIRNLQEDIKDIKYDLRKIKCPKCAGEEKPKEVEETKEKEKEKE